MSGPITEALTGFAELVASTSAFQSLTDSTSADEAMQHIYFGSVEDSDDLERPLVLVSNPPNSVRFQSIATGPVYSFSGGGELRIFFETPIDTTVTTEAEQYLSALADLEELIMGLLETSGQDDMPVISSLILEDGPLMFSHKKQTTVGDYFGSILRLTFGQR